MRLGLRRKFLRGSVGAVSIDMVLDRRALPNRQGIQHTVTRTSRVRCTRRPATRNCSMKAIGGVEACPVVSESHRLAYSNEGLFAESPHRFTPLPFRTDDKS